MVKLQLISCAKFEISELALPPFPLGVSSQCIHSDISGRVSEGWGFSPIQPHSLISSCGFQICFCFVLSLNASLDFVSGNIEILGEQNSLFRQGPVIKRFAI